MNIPFITLALASLLHSQVPPPEEIEAESRRQELAAMGGVKATALKATWEYSVDQGNTFSAERPATVDSARVKTILARGTFMVEDPDAIAGLWLGHDDAGAFLQRAAFCLAGKEEAGLKDGKTCGAMPLWMHTQVTLNGATPGGPLEAMLYRPLPIEPARLLKKGKNTLTVSGSLWCLTSPVQVPTRPLVLLAAQPQKAPLRSGPVLGDFGADFFTVSCRTALPAQVRVAATPLEPVGEKTAATSPLGLYHRLNISLPKGTKKFQYSVESISGTFKVVHGPFEVSRPAEESLRVVALGNTRCNKYSDHNAPLLASGMLKTRPHLFLHLGQVMELSSWDYHWDPHFFAPYASLLAAVPTYVAPGPRDHVGLWQKTFTLPPLDGKLAHWTKVQGPVRFIGLDGATDWSAGSASALWLDKVLQSAKDKFVVALNHFPGYSSGQQSKPAGNGTKMPRPLQECRDVVLPLLAKHRVTVLLSAFDYNYERCEADGAKGITCLIVGGGGAKAMRQGGRAANNNPFTNTGPFVGDHAFALFEVHSDRCELTAINVKGEIIDRKTFKPRN